MLRFALRIPVWRMLKLSKLTFVAQLYLGMRLLSAIGKYYGKKGAKKDAASRVSLG